MISKKIHYCWFGGGNMSRLHERCIESWKNHMPDFEIIRWDESNSDISDPAVNANYLAKRWAFVSDYIRLKALSEHGGIYLDVDIEVVRSLEPLLNCEAFIGEEMPGRLNTAVLGSVKGGRYVESCLNLMVDRMESNKAFLIAPEVATKVYETVCKEVEIFPCQAFYPYNPYNPESLGQLLYSDVTNDTFAIHHWGKSWNESFMSKVIRKMRLLGAG